MPSLFDSDFDYAKAALNHLRARKDLQVEFYPEEERLDLTAPPELKERFDLLPRDVFPENGRFVLTGDPDAVQAEIRRCRQDELAWPNLHYLWEQHPVVQWLNDKVTAAFGRHEAPVLVVPETLSQGEAIFVLSGIVPNRKSHPLVHRWLGVRFRGGEVVRMETFGEVLRDTGLGSRSLPNRGLEGDREALEALLPDAVEEGRRWMLARRDEFESRINEKLNEELEELERLRARQYEQLDLKYDGADQLSELLRGRRAQERRKVDRLFDEYIDWVEDTMTTESTPYLQVVAVLTGG